MAPSAERHLAVGDDGAHEPTNENTDIHTPVYGVDSCGSLGPSVQGDDGDVGDARGACCPDGTKVDGGSVSRSSTPAAWA